MVGRRLCHIYEHFQFYKWLCLTAFVLMFTVFDVHIYVYAFDRETDLLREHSF